MRSVPDFCSVYVISKGKVSSAKKAVRDAPSVSPLRTQLESQNSMKQEKVEFQVVNALRGLIIYIKQCHIANILCQLKCTKLMLGEKYYLKHKLLVK
jgi:hypothetical protein